MWTKIVAEAVVVLLIGVAVWGCWPSKEPVYKGRTLRVWLSGCRDRTYRQPDTDEALCFFGTNTLPYIRAGLRARDTWGRRALGWAADKAPWLRIRVLTAEEKQTMALLAYNRCCIPGATRRKPALLKFAI